MGNWKNALVIFAVLGIMSCGRGGMHPAATFEQLAADPSPKETLVPGDVIDVKFYYPIMPLAPRR